MNTESPTGEIAAEDLRQLHILALVHDDPDAIVQVSDWVRSRATGRNVDHISELIEIRRHVEEGGEGAAEYLYRCAEAAVLLLNQSAFKHPEWYQRFAAKGTTWPTLKSVHNGPNSFTDELMVRLGVGKEAVGRLARRKIQLDSRAVQVVLNAIREIDFADISQAKVTGIRKLPLKITKASREKWLDAILAYWDSRTSRDEVAKFLKLTKGTREKSPTRTLRKRVRDVLKPLTHVT